MCPATGLRVYAGAQALTLANAVAAVLALALGGLFGGLIGLSRSPALEFLGPSTYYASLTAHGVAALVLWPVFFEVAAMVFTSTILLNARAYSMALGWASFGLMVVGALVTFVSIMSGEATVMFTAYPPLVATPAFYVGYLVFAVGTPLAIVNFALSVVPGGMDRGVRSDRLPRLVLGPRPPSPVRERRGHGRRVVRDHRARVPRRPGQ